LLTAHGREADFDIQAVIRRQAQLGFIQDYLTCRGPIDSVLQGVQAPFALRKPGGFPEWATDHLVAMDIANLKAALIYFKDCAVWRQEGNKAGGIIHHHSQAVPLLLHRLAWRLWTICPIGMVFLEHAACLTGT
jgi:hypothetical protein